MKLLFKDFKKGKIKAKIDSLDDLWYLSTIIEEGDLISGQTTRKIVFGDKQQKTKSEKKSVFLKIKVKKLEFHKYSNVLRVSGDIIEGPEFISISSAHSFELKEGTIFNLFKENWLKFQKDKILESSKDISKKILICVMDRENAYFALSKKYGYEFLGKFKGDVEKKEEGTKSKGNFYPDIIKDLQKYTEKYHIEHIILASPAFFKEDLFKLIKGKKIKNKVVLATCSNVGKNGINEVLKRQEIQQILLQDKVSNEIKIVENLLQEISKDNLATYGIKGVEKALDAGAIKTLLITDSYIHKKREQEKFKEIDMIMRTVEQIKGKINLISKDHEGGKKLDGLGGIAALLRYKINY